jgi:DNA-binding MarR family transcriptional regulator
LGRTVVVEAVTAGGEHPVADGLIRLSVLTQSAFARVAERHGLPAAQARLLCVLAGGARGMSELATLLGIEKAALTGLADRAERRGLIIRTAVPGDRRALSVALTPGGRDAASAFHLELSAELARLTDVLPPAERDRFCRSLARVTADAPWPVRGPVREAGSAGSRPGHRRGRGRS